MFLPFGFLGLLAGDKISLALGTVGHSHYSKKDYLTTVGAAAIFIYGHKNGHKQNYCYNSQKQLHAGIGTHKQGHHCGDECHNKQLLNKLSAVYKTIFVNHVFSLLN